MILIAAFVAVLACQVAYALESELMDMYDELQKESENIKVLMKNTKDIVLVSSMWDSTILTMTQLEAYFSMVGVFNAIDMDEMDEGAINHLILWLNKIKATNELNIKSLDAVKMTLNRKTELHTAVLKVYYRKLNDKIDAELEKLLLIEESLKVELPEE